MDLDQFLQDLGLPVNAELDPVERAFMEKLKLRLLHVVQNYNETELAAEDMGLRQFLRQYFDFTLLWLKKEAGRYNEIKEFDTAPAIRQQAKAVVGDLQSYIADFVSCYMHINRFMTLLRDEIKAEEIKVAIPASQRVRWTADAGVLIGRYRKEKKQLVERTERLVRARRLLEVLEGDLNLMREDAAVLFGKDKGEAYVRKFFAALRVIDWRKAEKAMKEIADSKTRFAIDAKAEKQHRASILAAGARIVALIKNNQDELTSEENRVFLKPVESDLAYNADIRELKKIKAFLAKYHLPYMQYKLDTLEHLKDKLLVMNTLESLMTLYKRMILGIAMPLRDLKTVRLYESEIVNHVKYLLTGHMVELPKILQRAEETVHEFRQSRIELDSFAVIDLSEIQVSDPQAASL